MSRMSQHQAVAVRMESKVALETEQVARPSYEIQSMSEWEALDGLESSM